MMPGWAEDLKRRYVTKEKHGELVLRVCPYCNNTHWNFQVNIELCVYHCWVCGAKGGVKRLLYDASIEFDHDEVQPKALKKEVHPDVIELPMNRVLTSAMDRFAMAAKQYLYTRGVTDDTIAKWNFRICTGEDKEQQRYDYGGHVAVPLYGLHGLEYFIAARWRDGKGYRLPDVPKDRFVPMRRNSDTLVVVEGLFDATSVWQCTSYDVMMLMGKFVLKHQAETLVKVGYRKILICLDGDAQDSQLKLGLRLYQMGLPVHLVDLPHDKDPNDLGQGVKIYIDEATPYRPMAGCMARLDRIRTRGLL